MTSELPPERIAELREAFSLFDKDGSGSISMSEMKMVLLSLGVEPTDEDLKEIIEEFDSDNNNEIEFDEFVNIMANKFSKTDNEKMYMTVCPKKRKSLRKLRRICEGNF
jgi:calmodulin